MPIRQLVPEEEIDSITMLNWDKEEDIESASMIYWEKLEDVYSISLQMHEQQLQTSDNPETLLIEKDFVNALSKECQFMAKAIISLPEEIFLLNGKARKTKFREIMKVKTGWPVVKIEKVKLSLAHQLINTNNRKSQLIQKF